jgi:peptidoglycan hydrolase CwlO-like protein
MMDDTNREILQINKRSKENRLFYKKDSKGIDPEAHQKEGEQPEVLMRKDEPMQYFKKFEDSKIQIKTLKGQVKELQHKLKRSEQEIDRLKERIKTLEQQQIDKSKII